MWHMSCEKPTLMDMWMSTKRLLNGIIIRDSKKI